MISEVEDLNSIDGDGTPYHWITVAADFFQCMITKGIPTMLSLAHKRNESLVYWFSWFGVDDEGLPAMCGMGWINIELLLYEFIHFLGPLQS